MAIYLTENSTTVKNFHMFDIYVVHGMHILNGLSAKLSHVHIVVNYNYVV